MTTMSERVDRIRERQRGAADITPAEVAAAFEAHLTAHADHPWHVVGRCVFCGPCGTRLYQGTMPSDHPVWEPPAVARRRTAADEMRARWGK